MLKMVLKDSISKKIIPKPFTWLNNEWKQVLFLTGLHRMWHVNKCENNKIIEQCVNRPETNGIIRFKAFKDDIQYNNSKQFANPIRFICLNGQQRMVDYIIKTKV